MNTQFNPVSKAVFSGRNEASALAAKKEFGFKSDKWITYFQATNLGLQIERGTKAVGMIRFAKDNNGKSAPKWYNVFNLDQISDVPAEVSNVRTPKVTKKVAKASKKASKKASTKPTKAVKDEVSGLIAIPIQGQAGEFLIPDGKGGYSQVTLS